METTTTQLTTKVYQSIRGWEAVTRAVLNGKNWILTTMKRYNGTISTNCQVVQDEGNGNYSFTMFGDEKENFYLNEI